MRAVFILRTLAALRAAIALFDLRGFAALARFVVFFLVLPFAIAVGLVRAPLFKESGLIAHPYMHQVYSGVYVRCDYK